MLFRILLAAIIVHFKDKEIAWKYSQLKKCFWIKKIFLLCKKTFLLYVLTMSPTCFRVNPLYSCLNIKELLVRSRREIWSLSDCNWTRTHNHLAQPLASSAKCSSVRLWTKWLWARVQLQSLKTKRVSCWLWLSLWKFFWTRLEVMKLIQVSYLWFLINESWIVNEKKNIFYSYC